MTINLFDPEYRRDPHTALAKFRAEDPVQQDENGTWYILRHSDVVALNKDLRLGRDVRKWMAYPMIRPYLADSTLERCIEQWMFSLDPPEHTRLRSLVSKTFTSGAVEAMRGFIEQSASELLDGLAGRREFNLMEVFAQPFPVRVIARILGLSLDDYESLRRWSDAIALAIEPTVRRKQKLAADEAMVALIEYLREQVSRRRREPGNDLISALIRVEEAGDRLREDEMIAQLVLMFIAGHETTANWIGNGMLALLRHPDELARLRSDMSLLPLATEEMLRYESPANTNGRATHEEIEVGGKRIGAGQLVFCMLGSANRDPEVFKDPDRLDITRSPNPHVSFGGGIHFCVGAPLARLEARIAFEHLMKRFSRVEVHEPEVAWRDTINVRGLHQLPLRVEWT